MWSFSQKSVRARAGKILFGRQPTGLNQLDRDTVGRAVAVPNNVSERAVSVVLHELSQALAPAKLRPVCRAGSGRENANTLFVQSDQIAHASPGAFPCAKQSFGLFGGTRTDLGKLRAVRVPAGGHMRLAGPNVRSNHSVRKLAYVNDQNLPRGSIRPRCRGVLSWRRFH